jgi:hypothetical protein
MNQRFTRLATFTGANASSRSALSIAAATIAPPMISVFVPRLIARMRSRWCKSGLALMKKRLSVPLGALMVHQLCGGHSINGIHLTYPFYFIYNRAVNSNRCVGV